MHPINISRTTVQHMCNRKGIQILTIWLISKGLLFFDILQVEYTFNLNSTVCSIVLFNVIYLECMCMRLCYNRMQIGWLINHYAYFHLLTSSYNNTVTSNSPPDIWWAFTGIAAVLKRIIRANITHPRDHQLVAGLAFSEALSLRFRNECTRSIKSFTFSLYRGIYSGLYS
jgi:hypothetical protein